MSIYKVEPTFVGEFMVNIAIPDLFGIGGKVSAGFGIVKRRLDNDHYLLEQGKTDIVETIPLE